MALDLTKNPFFIYNRYDRKVVPAIIEGAEPTEEITKVPDVINLSLVKRFVHVQGVLVALFNDDHEDKVSYPQLIKGKQEMVTERRNTYTQIPIEDFEDVKRLFSLLTGQEVEVLTEAPKQLF